MKNIFKKLLIIILLTHLLFLTGCGILDTSDNTTYTGYVKTDNSNQIQFRADGINKKYNVVTHTAIDFEAQSVSDGSKTTTTFTGADLGLSASFTVNFEYENRESPFFSETRFDSNETRLLETDYHLGIHIPQQTNNGVVIGVLGRGVRMSHEAYTINNFWQNSGESCGNGADDDGNGYIDDCYGWDFNDNRATGTNEQYTNSHEQLVTGTIVGENIEKGLRGVNPSALIMPLKLHDDVNTLLDFQRTAEATRYVADNIINNGGKCIINMSFGMADSDSIFRNALAYAYSKGCLIFTATGNSGAIKTSLNPEFYGVGIDPDFHVIGVTGHSVDGTQRYSGSSWANSVTFAGPVYAVYSTAINGYTSLTGTSFASPVLAGLASLIWGNDPTLSREQVIQKLKDYAVSIGSSEETGYGRINVQSLVESYVDLHYKTIQADIDNDGQLEQLKVEISTYKDTGAIYKGYITHIIDNGVQYSVFREI